MFAQAGPGVLALEGCVRRVDVLGPRHVAPCLRSTCAEVCLEDVACRPLWVGKERGVVGVALGHYCICVGVIYTMVMVAPTRRRVSTSPAGRRWMSVCVATSGPC